MSIQSFLAKIWKQIKSIFDSIPAELKSAVHLGVIITENIKNFVDSPTADVLTALIPGETDDHIKEILRLAIPKLLTELKLVDKCSGRDSQQDIIKCAAKELQSLDSNIKNAFLHNLSIMIAQVASDGKLSWSDGVYLLEWYYQHEYKLGQSLK